jgi:general secretion pathway protein K
VDSVLDWKDPDDLHRLNGAESDYYMALQNPYEAKNANFDTVEELALVKGVTSEVLYGGNDTKGIIDFLTVHSKSGMINMLAAPREVLLAIPGMTQELADDITSKRETPGPPDPQGIVPPPESLPYASLNYGSPASTFTVESFGQKGDEKGGHAIRATVVIELTNKPKFLYYKSPATLWQ